MKDKKQQLVSVALKNFGEREKSDFKKDLLVICFTDTKKHFAIQKHIVEIGKAADYFVIQ